LRRCLFVAPDGADGVMRCPAPHTCSHAHTPGLSLLGRLSAGHSRMRPWSLNIITAPN
jgi:hypothetical protein